MPEKPSKKVNWKAFCADRSSGEKMIKKWEKIEANLNKALEKLMGKLWLCLLVFIPKKLQKKIKTSFKKFSENYLYYQVKVFRKFEQAKIRRAQRSKKIKELKATGQYFGPKEKAKAKVAKLRDALLRTPLKNRAEFVSSKLNLLIEKIASVPRTQFLIAFCAMLMIFTGTYSVYTSSQNIYMQEWGGRSPASADQYLERPNYLKYPARTMKVFNVKVPIYVESVKSVRSVTVDFSVRTDTRFARMFLEEYEYKLKDHFFMTTEPMMSSFPLEEEGKLVLKEKIQDELNLFLEENKVEGHVLDVDLIFIVGS